MKQYRTQADVDAELGPQQTTSSTTQASMGNAALAAQAGGASTGSSDGGASSEWAASGDVQAQHGSGHHDEIGGEETVQVGPHTVTTGQLNELVDYVTSLDELAALTPEQFARGLELIHVMEEEGLSADESADFDAIFPNYAAIALDNSDHFAPPSDGVAPAGSANFLGQIRQHYGEAHDLAASGDLNGAVALAGWGGHYVADAFSAGHLFNKDEIMVNADTHLDQFGRVAVFGSAAAEIIAEGTHVAKWGVKKLTGGVRDLTCNDIAVMLGAADVFQHTAITGAIAKAIHDRLAGDGSQRIIEVESSGRTWLLGGDGDLDPVAKEIASGIVHHAYEDLETVSKDPGHLSREDFLAEIEAGLPTPTAEGQALIDQIISNVFESPVNFAHALAEASLHEFDTIMAGFQALPLGDLVIVRRDGEETEEGGGDTIGDLYGNIDQLIGGPETITGSMETIHELIGDHSGHSHNMDNVIEFVADNPQYGDTLGSIDEILAMLGQ